MRTLGTTSLLALALVLAACGGANEPVPPGPTPAPTDTAPAPTPDAGAEPPGVKPTACAAPLSAPTCAATKPAPTDTAGITRFVKEAAVPLACDDPTNGKALWDLRPMVSLYGESRMFMVGEVHGTNEIGIVSALLLEQLASAGLVNVVASELPMDFEPSLRRYVKDGRDPMAEQLIGRGAPNFFGAILTKTARDLEKRGVTLTVGAVDIPYDPRVAVTAIEEIAQKLTTQKDTVLTTLPKNAQEPPTPADITAANGYYDLIRSKKSEICAELSAAECDRLDAMTHALWASTLAYDQQADQEEWFRRREVVIYYNMKSLMPTATERMFLHMGAAHTNKHTFSAGSRMSNEYALTKGRVFSVAPAYGDGSVIWYGGDQRLPGEPESIVAALGDAPKHPFFVSTTRPSAACEENPVGQELEGTLGAGGRRAQLYDGYIHYGKVTSERRPSDTNLDKGAEILGGPKRSAAATSSGVPTALEAKVARVLDFRARILEKERAAIAKGALTRAR